LNSTTLIASVLAWLLTTASGLLAYFSFDWERFVSAVGIPCAILVGLAWFFWRAWGEFAPVIKQWLQSQIENDKVHRKAVDDLAGAYRELAHRIDRVLRVAERVIKSNGNSHARPPKDES
jgi:hypothetical protein